MNQVLLLWELQQNQSELEKIGKKLQEIKKEDKLENIKLGLKQLEYDLTTNKTHLEMKKIEVKRSEKKHKQIEDNLKLVTSKLYDGSISNIKQLTQLQEEETSLRKQCTELENKIYEDMEKIEEYINNIEIKQVEFDKLNKSVAVLQKKYTNDTADLYKIYNELLEKIKKVNEKIDPEFLKKYNLIIKRKHKAVVKIKNECCTGCHMNISLSTISKLKKDKAVCYCDNCGRILLYTNKDE
ncbi:zinc ribbon domain-containing protein [Abyssisolibacter fermentans]|uniref:zinc ribbon domain-containing protein n=1 Tax=Abyssisolibacter fermentans TaxID=1766203 RepID=UPI00082D8130|nr:C4-type zinc ribbon domain-containing protein [Abyssisolibacter fermentans]